MVNLQTSVVMSKIHKGPSPIKIKNLHKSLQNANDSDDHKSATNSRPPSQQSVSKKNKSRHANSYNSRISKKTSKEEAKSVVQMIELELPNVHIDESKVSPQRVKVLSREFTA